MTRKTTMTILIGVAVVASVVRVGWLLHDLRTARRHRRAEFLKRARAGRLLRRLQDREALWAVA